MIEVTTSASSSLTSVNFVCWSFTSKSDEKVSTEKMSKLTIETILLFRLILSNFSKNYAMLKRPGVCSVCINITHFCRTSLKFEFCHFYKIEV